MDGEGSWRYCDTKEGRFGLEEELEELRASIPSTDRDYAIELADRLDKLHLCVVYTERLSWAFLVQKQPQLDLYSS